MRHANAAPAAAIDQFKAAMHAAGLEPPDVIEPGKMHRFPTNGKAGDDAGWYVFYGDDIPAGSFGDWRTGFSQTWRADIGRKLSQAEEAAHGAKVEAMRREREAKEAKNRAKTASNAAAIWTAAEPASGDHPYLVRKAVKAYGLRLYRGDLVIAGMPCDGCLIVPARDGSGVIHTLQFIHPERRDGDNKRFLPGGATSGGYYCIDQPDSVLCIAEGFATAATIHEATGRAAVVAFNAGNLDPVARALRARFPDIKIVLCADDDAKTPGNPGMTKAGEAARAIGGLLAIPEFGPDRPDGVSDFNDLAAHSGMEAVKLCIKTAVIPPETGDNVVARLAALPQKEYESVRHAEAKKLKWRVLFLDSEVTAARAKIRKEKAAAFAANRAAITVPCPQLDDDVIVLVDSAFKASGYGGDTRLPALLYLCLTTRLLSFAKGNMLGHAQVVGAPSSGKNFAVDKALSLLPEDACLRIDAGTPKALIYSEEDLQHRIVVFAEADSLPISEGASGLADGDSRSTAASALRSLASDGHLSFDVVERGDDGKFVTRHIHKDGPTLLLTTTTKAISGQMGTRLWEVPVKESDAQITAALRAGVKRDATEAPAYDALVSYQAYLQSKAPWNVVVPFHKELVECLIHKGMSPRILRDTQRILSLIKAVAVLRHPARERDGDGRLIATLDDYQSVYDVLYESYAATINDGLTEDVLEVIAAVAKIRHECAAGVTYNDVAKELGWHRDKVSRRAQVAMKHDWLVNKQEKRRQSAILDIGAETPESRGLPTVERIQLALSPQKPCVRAYVNKDAGFSLRTPNTHAADGTQDDAYLTARTQDVRNDGAHVKANENATYARTHAFRGDISGDVVEGGTDDGGEDKNSVPAAIESVAGFRTDASKRTDDTDGSALHTEPWSVRI